MQLACAQVDAARRGQTLPASGGQRAGVGTRTGRAGGTLNMSRGCTGTLNSMGGVPLGDGPQLYSFLNRAEELAAEASRGGTVERNKYHERGAAATLGGAGRPAGAGSGAGSSATAKSPPSFVKPSASSVYVYDSSAL